MQGGMGNRDPFFGNGGPFSGFGGFGGQRSLLPGFFGGRDPFDDPFFTRPFGGLFESSFFGSNGNPFANMHPSPFDNMHPSGYIEQQVPEQKKSRGPIIEELDSDNEKTEGDEEKKVNPRKHGRRSKEPYVEDPDDEAEGEKSSCIMCCSSLILSILILIMLSECVTSVLVLLLAVRKSKQLQSRNDYSRFNGMGSQPQGLSFTFQSSSVIRGGANGAYYTSSSTRRAGSDGVCNFLLRYVCSCFFSSVIYLSL